MTDDIAIFETSHPLYDQIVENLKTVYDPEIPVNLFDLGLIYSIEITDDNDVLIDMTLTTPHCPVAEEMPKKVHESIKDIAGIREIKVKLVWDPPWDKSMMSDVAQLELNLF